MLSLGAIAYGLFIHWNPDSIVMASLAGSNCSFMDSTLAAGLQPKFRDFRLRRKLFDFAD
ncbi:MAG: hypothetical protein U5L96_11540 [Owenweeksia sp.]|nr:hypothetical protein [Owenweeksia sp.]